MKKQFLPFSAIVCNLNIRLIKHLILLNTNKLTIKILTAIKKNLTVKRSKASNNVHLSQSSCRKLEHLPELQRLVAAQPQEGEYRNVATANFDHTGVNIEFGSGKKIKKVENIVRLS